MRLRYAFLAAIPALALAAPAQAKDDLVIGAAQFPSTLNPFIDPEVIKNYALAFSQRQVSAFDKDWHPVCLLCAELPSLENGLAAIEDRPEGTKGMKITIKLKPGLMWGDGKPVTARDIAFTWHLASNPNTGSGNTYPWARASGVDVVDDSTAILHTDRIINDYMMWDQIVPEHLEGEIAAKATSPGDYIKNTLYAREPTTAGLWNGPYMITQYQSGSQVVFEPNPHWPGPKPALRRIVLRTIENTAALQANLLAGDVDLVAGEGVGLTIDQALALRKQAPDRFNYEFRPSLTYEHIDLNLDNPLLKDVRTRRALLLATDRQALATRLFEGLQPVAATWVNPLHPMYDASIKPAPYDLPGAKKLLQEAGWTPGSDGICRNAAGQRLSLEIATTAGNRLRELTEQVLQNNWKAACVDVTIKNEPARTLFGVTLKQRQYTGLGMYGWSSTVSESPRRTLGTSDIPAAANSYGGANYPGLSNNEMDANIAKVEAELDPAKAKADWAVMQRIYAEQVPVLPLFFRAEPHIVPKWLTGYQPLGNGYNVGIFAEDWKPQ
jgi:peptide/nickel transport system substrate-binding protein